MQIVILFQFQIKALSSLARLRLRNVLFVSLRRLNPHRFDFIFDFIILFVFITIFITIVILVSL